ncbi:hypothetical protein HDU96_004690 [Phlyctochytrium bullatum]|nr:hypothetical protein HDU96_004690 [Phlyctochytrium bullatum]
MVLRGRRRRPHNDDGLSEEETDSAVSSDSDLFDDDDEDEEEEEEEEEEEDEEELDEDNNGTHKRQSHLNEVPEDGAHEQPAKLTGSGGNGLLVEEPSKLSRKVLSETLADALPLSQENRTSTEDDRSSVSGLSVKVDEAESFDNRKQGGITKAGKSGMKARRGRGVFAEADRSRQQWKDDGRGKRAPYSNAPQAERPEDFWLHDDRVEGRRKEIRRTRGGYGKRYGVDARNSRANESISKQSKPEAEADEEVEELDFNDLQIAGEDWSQLEVSGAEARRRLDEEKRRQERPKEDRYDRREEKENVDVTMSERPRSTRSVGYGKRGYGAKASSLYPVETGRRFGSRPESANEVNPVDQKWAHDKFQPEAEEPESLSDRRSWVGGYRERKPIDKTAYRKRSSFSSHKSYGESDGRSLEAGSTQVTGRKQYGKRPSSVSEEPLSAVEASNGDAKPSSPSAEDPPKSPVQQPKQPPPRRLALGLDSSGAIPLWKRAAGEAAAEASIAAEAAKNQASLRAARKVASVQSTSPATESPETIPASVVSGHKSRRYLGTKVTEDVGTKSEVILKQAKTFVLSFVFAAIDAPEFVPKVGFPSALGSESSLTIVQEEEVTAEESGKVHRKEYNGPDRRKFPLKERSPSKSHQTTTLQNDNSGTESSVLNEHPGHEHFKDSIDSKDSSTHDSTAYGNDTAAFANSNWRTTARRPPSGVLDRPSSTEAPGFEYEEVERTFTGAPPQAGNRGRFRGGPRGRGTYTGPGRPEASNPNTYRPRADRNRKFRPEQYAEYNGTPGFEDYTFVPAQEESAIPVQPLVTGSGHMVIMTEGGLMVPTDNFMYGGYPAYQSIPYYVPAPYPAEMIATSQQYFAPQSFIPASPIPMVYPLPADPTFVEKKARAVEIKNPAGEKGASEATEVEAQ